jgi:hypothetical protein
MCSLLRKGKISSGRDSKAELRVMTDIAATQLNYEPIIDVTNTFKFRGADHSESRKETQNSIFLLHSRTSISVLDVHHWERSQGGQDY